ncbi:hypothetical protein Glove_426g101 [Diversispora epigaea]|uniref:Uncharacterized protein n=1 Tax=Diversispora epigaea TaxID=1348612 RepID=A0A397GU44_9GLOM|nr:hypothetical protein Glove_426g101 [Diversispora epigaea]
MSLSNIEYTGNDGLNYDFLIKQREKHEAYNSRPILRKLRTSNFQNSNSENSIQPNKASHIVAYFANNNDRDQNFIKQRENRWKHNHQKIAMSLANHNNEKSQQLYSGKRNAILYIGQVLALYYENYSNHSFNTKPVTKIDDISKVTLKVFLLINSNLFTQYTPEECNIFTHRNPSNIIFHILSDDVTINDQFLTLSNLVKDYYSYFKRNDVISLILNSN